MNRTKCKNASKSVGVVAEAIREQPVPSEASARASGTQAVQSGKVGAELGFGGRSRRRESRAKLGSRVGSVGLDRFREGQRGCLKSQIRSSCFETETKDTEKTFQTSSLL